jgi:hypothetical protein
LGGLHFQASPGKKVHEAPLQQQQQKNGVLWDAPVIPVVVCSQNRRIMVQSSLGKKRDYLIQNNQSKKG